MERVGMYIGELTQEGVAEKLIWLNLVEGGLEQAFFAKFVIRVVIKVLELRSLILLDKVREMIRANSLLRSGTRGMQSFHPWHPRCLLDHLPSIHCLRCHSNRRLSPRHRCTSPLEDNRSSVPLRGLLTVSERSWPADCTLLFMAAGRVWKSRTMP